MENLSGVFDQERSTLATQTHSTASLRFDWVVVALGLWMIGGVHLDAWAHHKLEVETFFTPWHGVLYSGFLALAAILMGVFIRNLWRGAAWREAMPVGYGLSLIGVVIFMVAGVADMLWHTLYGIEVDIEALLSPTHLLLAFGGALMVTGPLRAAWARPSNASQRWADLMPALLSLALLLALLAFFTAYVNPLSETLVATGHRPGTDEEVFSYQGLGIGAILLQSVIMMGAILLAVLRWRLPIGGLTLIISDLLESNDLAKALELLPAPAWDVVVFHLLHPQELQPALQGDFQMIDAESGKKINYDVDAKALQIYRQRIDAWSNDLEMICIENNAFYALIQADWSLENEIIPYLRAVHVVSPS